jgi:hypothetical protein
MMSVISQAPLAPIGNSPLEAIAASPSDVILDTAVIDAIGPEKELISAQRYGNSAWSSTARISVKNPDGSVHDYFVKARFFSPLTFLP